MKVKILTFLFLLIAGIAGATIPTLETDAGAATLEITDGTSGNPVTWDDTWNWPDGSSAGAGLVPKDGGGTARVDTFMTEIVADAVYIILKDIDFGDGASPTYFRSTNEMVYFEDGKVCSVKAQASLQLGNKVDDWGSEGSMWSFAPTSAFEMTVDSPLAVFNVYASKLHIRSGDFKAVRVRGTGEFLNSIFSSKAAAVPDYMQLFATDIIIKECYFNTMFRVGLDRTPELFSGNHIHDTAQGLRAGTQDVIITDASVTSSTSDYVVPTAIVLTVENPRIPIINPTIENASGAIIEQYTARIHVIDKDGADLEGVDIDVTYANLVEGDDGKDYICIVAHTSVSDGNDGQPPTNDGDGNWFLFDADVAADLGGDWNVGFDYKDDEPEFATGITNADGDMLGEELITNGDFSDGSTGWTLDAQWIAGPGTLRGTANGSRQQVGQEFEGIKGNWYEIAYDIISNNLVGDDFISWSSSSLFDDDPVPSTVGSHRLSLLATNNVAALDFDWELGSGSSSGLIVIDNISVREVTPVIQYKKWVGTSEVLEARIHKFTFTIDGYKPLVMENVIVDHPLVWEIEMPLGGGYGPGIGSGIGR